MARCTVKIAWILGMTEASPGPGHCLAANITMFNFNVPCLRFFEIHKKVKIQLKHGKVGWAQLTTMAQDQDGEPIYLHFYNVQMFP